MMKTKISITVRIRGSAPAMRGSIIVTRPESSAAIIIIPEEAFHRAVSQIGPSTLVIKEHALQIDPDPSPYLILISLI
jgi:hypothetical protein